MKSFYLILPLIVATGVYVFFTHKNTSAPSPWLKKMATYQKEGRFTSVDSKGTPILLEWHSVNTWSPEFIEISKSLNDVWVTQLTPVEVDYYKTHTEEIMTSEHLQSFRPLLVQGIEHVDWQKFSATMAELLRDFCEADLKAFFGEHDMSIFVKVSDQGTHKLLGAIQYIIKQSFPYGTVNLGNLAIVESARNRGLGKLLTSSLFKILPETTTIFLYTRTTNEIAQKAYSSYGFKQNQEPITDPIFAKGWLMMEYSTKESGILQNVANNLK